jgi:hypothetical protein
MRTVQGQIPLAPPFQKREACIRPPLCNGETEGILEDCDIKFFRSKTLLNKARCIHV